MDPRRMGAAAHSRSFILARCRHSCRASRNPRASCISPASTRPPGWDGCRGRLNRASGRRPKCSRTTALRGLRRVRARMIQVLLVLHVLVGATLLGAITHQSFSVARSRSAPPRSFVDRFRGVNSPTFTNVIVLLFFRNVVLGGLLYPRYRVDVRPDAGRSPVARRERRVRNEGALRGRCARSSPRLLARLAATACRRRVATRASTSPGSSRSSCGGVSSSANC